MRIGWTRKTCSQCGDVYEVRDGAGRTPFVCSKPYCQRAAQVVSPDVPCEQCGRPLNPAARMLGPTCKKCVREAHRAAVSGNEWTPSRLPVV